MPKRPVEPDVRSIELLEKLVLLQLYALGATQDKIARFLGKQKAWVNATVKGIPRQED